MGHNVVKKFKGRAWPVPRSSRTKSHQGERWWPLCFSWNILKWAKLPLICPSFAERGDGVVKVSHWATLAARCMLRSGMMREIWSCTEGLGVAGSWAPIWEGRGGGFCFAAGEPDSQAPWLLPVPHTPTPAPRHAHFPTPYRSWQIEPARKEKEAGARVIVVVTQQQRGTWRPGPPL